MIIRDFSVKDISLMEKVENCFNEGNILVFYDLNGEKKAIKRGIYFSLILILGALIFAQVLDPKFMINLES